MNFAELARRLDCGEDSRQQFKRDFAHVDGLAAELAALANSGGGCLFLGVEDNGAIAGNRGFNTPGLLRRR